MSKSLNNDSALPEEKCGGIRHEPVLMLTCLWCDVAVCMLNPGVVWM